MIYGDHHIKFLQYMMSCKMASLQEVKDMVGSCCRSTGVPTPELTLENLYKFCGEINQQIKRLYLEIKHGVCEDTSKMYFALVITVNNKITKSGNTYSVNELELFKKIVEEIMTSDDGSVSSIVCLNLSSILPTPISISDAENLISRFISDKWLKKVEGQICLNVRSILELDQYIKQNFGDFVCICPICNMLVIRGFMCAKCDGKVHKHCLVHYFERCSRHKCPQCKEIWEGTEILSTRSEPTPKLVGKRK